MQHLVHLNFVVNCMVNCQIMIWFLRFWQVLKSQRDAEERIKMNALQDMTIEALKHRNNHASLNDNLNEIFNTKDQQHLVSLLWLRLTMDIKQICMIYKYTKQTCKIDKYSSFGMHCPTIKIVRLVKNKNIIHHQ